MISRFNTLVKTVALSAALTVLSTVPVMAAHGSSNLERARELSRSTTDVVNNVKNRIESVDADSVASMVVMQLPDEDDSVTEVAESRAVDVDEDSLDVDIPANSWRKIFLPLMGIVFGVTVPFAAFVLMVYFICRASVQRKRAKYDVIARAAESGHPLPPEFYITDTRGQKNKLQSGIVWIGWGAAFIIMSVIGIGRAWVAFGMIPLFIGLSRLAVYFLDRHNSSHNDVCTPSDNVENAQQD